MTNTLLAHIVDYHHCSQTPSPMVTLIEQFASPSEKEILLRITKECILSATLLPIFSVGVQVSNPDSFICHPISSYLLISSVQLLFLLHLCSLSSSSFFFMFLPSFLLLLFLSPPPSSPFSSSFSSFLSLSSLCVLVFLSHPTLSSPLLSCLYPFPFSSPPLPFHALTFLSHPVFPLSHPTSPPPPPPPSCSFATDPSSLLG